MTEKKNAVFASAVFVLSTLAEAYKGELAKRIIEVIAEKGQTTDAEIAEILGESESEIRKIIWILSTEGLLISKKVVSDTGWITFYWVLPIEQVDGIILGLYRKIIDRLEKRIEYESQNIFYWCGDPNHPKYTFSEAADLMFKCKLCGKTLLPYDNTKLIAALSWALAELKKIYQGYFETVEIKEEDLEKEDMKQSQ